MENAWSHIGQERDSFKSAEDRSDDDASSVDRFARWKSRFRQRTRIEISGRRYGASSGLGLEQKFCGKQILYN